MAQADWNGEGIAKSDDTMAVEGNHYFPRESVQDNVLRESDHTTTCPWKSQASYYDLDGGANENAAWSYPVPRPDTERIRGRVASGTASSLRNRVRRTVRRRRG